MLTTSQLLNAVEDTGRTLSDSLKQAVSHDVGPMWVLAGPGSGKTELLVLRTLKLLMVDRVEPRSVILTTFTEKAARSLQERLLTRKAAIDNKFPSVANIDVMDVRVGTLHSLANNTMREFCYIPYQDMRLLDELQHLMFVYKEAAIAAGSSGLKKKPPSREFWTRFKFLVGRDSEFYPSRWVRAKAGVEIFDRIVDFRVNMDSMKQASDEQVRSIAELYEDYRNELESQRRADFAHVQEHFLKFLESPQSVSFLEGDETPLRPGVSHVLVDEYQDTNPIQEAIYLRLASRPPHNLTVVGDDEQALYRFRGGDVTCILSFPIAAKEYFGTEAKKVYLTTNYRSREPIVDFFNELVSCSNQARTLRELIGKPNIRAMRCGRSDYPVVSVLKRPQVGQTAFEFAELVRSLKTREIISDYSDCTLLVRSTREQRRDGTPTETGEFTRALRSKGIPIYNPRSRALMEQLEVQITVGAMLEALDSENRLTEFSQNQPRCNRIMQDWRDTFRKACSDSPLGVYVRHLRDAIGQIPRSKWIDLELLETFYALISQQPLRGAQDNPEQTHRLSILSSVLDAYTRTYGTLLRTDDACDGEVSIRWKRTFYHSFLELLISEGVNDFESHEESLPKGRLPVLTFHQAKGLEFPIVFVGSLDVGLDDIQYKSFDKEYALEDLFAPYRISFGMNGLASFEPSERAEQDTVRLYYVAYSRARDALILLAHDPVRGQESFLLRPRMKRMLREL